MNFENEGENIKFPGIAREISEMCRVDQEMRERWEENPIVPDEDSNIDEENTNRMREIIEEIGWPTISKVGKETAEEAWLLVQHADHDVDFQLDCLNLMKQEAPTEVDMINIVYLEDRVRVNQGVGQLYGTQFMQEKNQHIPREIEDPENIDERRAKIGLGPLQEQIDMMYEKYPFKQD